jgi:putative ABC transport system permease protein
MMAMLTNEHIDFIIKDLSYRGVVLDGFKEEMVDHICSAVEVEMENGKRFIDAYHEVLRKFGHTSGLRYTQKQIIITENKTTRLMLRNYFTIALRNLSKNAFYTVINVAGLAIGIGACLVISLYVMHELSYDHQFKNAGTIYRVDNEILFNGNHLNLAVSPAPLAETFVRDFPEVENATRFRFWGSFLVKRTTENIKEERICFADNNMFDVFSIGLLKGNASSALTEPNTMVLNKTTADKYFPGENPIGQTLILNNKENYKVTGVFEDFPQTSHLKFHIFLSMAGFEDSRNPTWLSNNYATYIRLREGANPESLEAKFGKMIETYAGPEIQMVFGKEFTIKKFLDSGNKFQFTLMPLTKIHLHSDKTAELGVNSDITYVYLFAAIAFFILVIACINFMNLSTARSSNRAKEVGIRKVLGSLRSHLVKQFLSESILLTMVAFMIGITIAAFFLPAFNTLSQRQIEVPYSDPIFVTIVVGAMLVIGLLAGLYPSLFLSGFKPVNVLKGKIALGMKSGAIRSTLVVFQFMISIFLVIGTITIQKQLSFIQNKKLGFKKDQVIVVHDTDVLVEQAEAFKNQVLKNHIITHGSMAGYLPISGWGRNDSSFWPEGTQPSQENMISMQNWAVDFDYLNTFGMEVKEGRNFSVDFPSDSTAIILNESAVKRFGFTDPIGKKIERYAYEGGAIENHKTVSYTIVGVVKDFHFESLKQNIGPLGLYMGKRAGMMSFRFESANTQDVIKVLDRSWKAMAPGLPLQYTFLDEAFGNMYSSEQRLGNIFAIFAGLAILIACLGLFALSAFTAEQRTKEIGIRKVLGASVPSIVLLLSKEFGKLIIIAFVLAAPLSWFAVNWWLQNYTYKAEVGIFIYALAGIAAFVIAWVTMGYQSVKAATSNPVDSLRSE